MSEREPAQTKVREMSIVSISVGVAICVALVVVLIRYPSFEVGFNAASIGSGALLITIVSYILANDFFLLYIYHAEHESFAFLGSALYGWGEVCLIVGASLTLKVLTTDLFAYLFLGVFTLGFLVFHVNRLLKLGRETPFFNARVILRLLYHLLLIFGFVMISIV